ncbi:hypothetical protein AB0C59_33830 [Streptomyces sp. NPDC048664]|uniref:hypothetical protein n=1 Tax=Streptomyces sp. NPDC048664 TaxID=3154505 RepID=UPI00343B134A
MHPRQRPEFGEPLTYARPGDTVHISEMFRLVRGNQHILDVLDVLHRDRLALRAAEAKGGRRPAEAKGGRRPAEAKGGRRPAVAADDVRTAYLEGRSIAARARDHGVSRGAIRTAVADLRPDHTAIEAEAPAPEPPVTLEGPPPRRRSVLTVWHWTPGMPKPAPWLLGLFATEAGAVRRSCPSPRQERCCRMCGVRTTMRDLRRSGRRVRRWPC